MKPENKKCKDIIVSIIEVEKSLLAAALAEKNYTEVVRLEARISGLLSALKAIL